MMQEQDSFIVTTLPCMIFFSMTRVEEKFP